MQEKPAGVSWHTPSWSQGEEAQPSMYSKSCSGRCETNRVPFWNARVSGAPAAFAETSPLSKVRVAVSCWRATTAWGDGTDCAPYSKVAMSPVENAARRDDVRVTCAWPCWENSVCVGLRSASWVCCCAMATGGAAQSNVHARHTSTAAHDDGRACLR